PTSATRGRSGCWWSTTWAGARWTRVPTASPACPTRSSPRRACRPPKALPAPGVSTSRRTGAAFTGCGRIHPIGGKAMSTSVKDLSVDELRAMIEDTVRRTMEDYLEDLQALSSPTYVDSIAEAREDYRAGRTGLPARPS